MHLPSALVGKTDFLLRFVTWEPLGLGFGGDFFVWLVDFWFLV